MLHSRSYLVRFFHNTDESIRLNEKFYYRGNTVNWSIPLFLGVPYHFPWRIGSVFINSMKRWISICFWQIDEIHIWRSSAASSEQMLKTVDETDRRDFVRKGKAKIEGVSRRNCLRVLYSLTIARSPTIWTKAQVSSQYKCTQTFILLISFIVLDPYLWSIFKQTVITDDLIWDQ